MIQDDLLTQAERLTEREGWKGRGSRLSQRRVQGRPWQIVFYFVLLLLLMNVLAILDEAFLGGVVSGWAWGIMFWLCVCFLAFWEMGWYRTEKGKPGKGGQGRVVSRDLRVDYARRGRQRILVQLGKFLLALFLAYLPFMLVSNYEDFVASLPLWVLVVLVVLGISASFYVRFFPFFLKNSRGSSPTVREEVLSKYVRKMVADFDLDYDRKVEDPEELVSPFREILDNHDWTIIDILSGEYRYHDLILFNLELTLQPGFSSCSGPEGSLFGRYICGIFSDLENDFPEISIWPRNRMDLNVENDVWSKEHLFENPRFAQAYRASRVIP